MAIFQTCYDGDNCLCWNDGDNFSMFWWWDNGKNATQKISCYGDFVLMEVINILMIEILIEKSWSNDFWKFSYQVDHTLKLVSCFF